jgi:hypothetical protein
VTGRWTGEHKCQPAHEAPCDVYATVDRDVRGEDPDCLLPCNERRAPAAGSYRSYALPRGRTCRMRMVCVAES